MQAILKKQYPVSVSAALSLVWSSVGLTLIPAQFGFTYVQTVLFFVSALSGMARTDKDIFYDLSTVIVSIPVGLAGWLEAVTCEYFIIWFGGHLVYDMTINIGLFVYFAVVMSMDASTFKSKVQEEPESKPIDSKKDTQAKSSKRAKIEQV